MYIDKAVSLPIGDTTLEGQLTVPLQATGLVLYGQTDAGNHQHSRCRLIIKQLLGGDLGVLCVDLLTPAELRTSDLPLDAKLLTQRLTAICQWVQQQPALRGQRLGLLASGTAATAALDASVALGHTIGTTVIFAGHPDQAALVIPKVRVPTLVLVSDETMLQWRERVAPALREPGEVRAITRADSSFREVEALREVTHAAATWYNHHLSLAADKQAQVAL